MLELFVFTLTVLLQHIDRFIMDQAIWLLLGQWQRQIMSGLGWGDSVRGDSVHLRWLHVVTCRAIICRKQNYIDEKRVRR